MTGHTQTPAAPARAGTHPAPDPVPAAAPALPSYNFQGTITDGVRGGDVGVTGQRRGRSAGLEVGGRAQCLSRDGKEARTSRTEGGLGEKQEPREGQGWKDGTQGRGACDLVAGAALTRGSWSSGGSGQREARADAGLLLGDRTRDTTQGGALG